MGSKCTFKDFSTFCEPCGDNEIGTDGIECTACPSGTQPDESHTQCLPCEPGQYSQIGLCIACAAGKTNSDDFTVCAPCEPGTFRSAEESSCAHCPAGSQPNSGKTACERCTGKKSFSPDGRECHDCPARNAPNEERTACFCQANTYSAKMLGQVTCRGTSFRSDGVETDECAVCPSCMDCAVVGTTILKSGCILRREGEGIRAAPASSRHAHRCSSIRTPQWTAACAMGGGPVCGNCQPEYNHLKVGNPCDPCDDGVINVPVLGLPPLPWLLAARDLWRPQRASRPRHHHRPAAPGRLLPDLGQAGNVLDLVFPYPVPQLVDFIKLLFLDVQNRDAGLLNIGGFYGTVTNILVVPAVIAGVCWLIYLSQKRTSWR